MFLLFAAGCPKPQPIQFAAVPANVLEVNYFPAGTVVTYRCNRGYRIIPGQRPSEATCLQNLTWTKAAEFCEGNIIYNAILTLPFTSAAAAALD